MKTKICFSQSLKIKQCIAKFKANNRILII